MKTKFFHLFLLSIVAFSFFGPSFAMHKETQEERAAYAAGMRRAFRGFSLSGPPFADLINTKGKKAAQSPSHIQIDLQDSQETNSSGSKEDLQSDINLPCKNISSNETRFINQKEFSVASAEDEKHVLATLYLGPCVAIGIYNPILKRASLASCGKHTSSQSITAPVYQACGETDYSQIKIYLLSQSKDNLSRFHSQLMFLGFPDSVFTSIVTNTALNVGIDAKSGTFFYYNYSPIEHKDEACIKRIARIKRVGQIALHCAKDTLDFVQP